MRLKNNFQTILFLISLIAGATLALIRHISRNVLRTSPALGKPQSRVVWISPDKSEITFTKNAYTTQVGQYTLIFGEHEFGLLKIGPVIATDQHTVTRELHRVDQGKVRIGDPVWQKSWYFNEPEEIDDQFIHANIPSKHGVLPSWTFLSSTDSESTRWAVLIHGRGADMRETLKAVPVLTKKGIHVLVISYRNDEVATPTPTGLGGLGLEEWEDLDAAVHYLEHVYDAQEIILGGWSMGASISTQYLLNTQLRRKQSTVIGVFFDCPAVDWETILREQATQSSMPRFIQRGVLWMLQSPVGQRFTRASQTVNFKKLSMIEQHHIFTMPTLIFHGAEDALVPSIFSEILAHANTENIELEIFEEATHVRTWNTDPQRWEKRLTQWIDSELKVESKSSANAEK